MSKVIIQNKHGKISVTNYLTSPEALNEHLLNSINFGMFEDFIPLSVEQKKNKCQISCSVQGLQTITQFFSGFVSKYMFLDLAYKITLIIKKCEKSKIYANNLELQKDCIFIDPITKAVKCIYWPIVNNQHSDPPHVFLKQLPYNMKFSPHEDNSYVDKYSSFFNGYDPFSINDFEKLILSLQGKDPNSGTEDPSDSDYGSLNRNKDPKKVKDDKSKKEDIEYDPFSGIDIEPPEKEKKENISNGHICCIVCGTKNPLKANFCCSCGAELETAKKYVFNSDGNGGFENKGFTASAFPVLQRSKTKKKYSINKPVYIIGSDESSCDLLIDDNQFISRNHANIIIKEHKYYVVDHKSTNKTSVNGNIIDPETEVEIFDGTVIKFANEKFVFLLQ